MIEVIHTEKAALPLGHYSQAVVHHGTIYISTQLGIVPGKPLVVGSIEEQTTAALENVRAILEAAGSSLENVLKVTIYISDSEFWERVNHIYLQFFKNHRPARGVIPVRELHTGFQVAIDVIAAV